MERFITRIRKEESKKKKQEESSPDTEKIDQEEHEFIPIPVKRQRKLKTESPNPKKVAPSTAKADIQRAKESAKKAKPLPKPPTGEGLLSGKIFVITGELSGFTRIELTDQLKNLGAKVTNTVSKRTYCLVYGQKLEDGRAYTEGKKYRTALELGTKLMDEEEIERLIIESTEELKRNPAPRLSVPAPVSSNMQSFSIPDQLKENVPWTEKYKPQTSDDIVGNTSALNKLREWLADWETVILFGQKKEMKLNHRNKFDPTVNVNAKAALLSGTPGIGKTSAARILAQEMGFNLTEMNASDLRSRKAIISPLKSASLSNALTSTGEIARNIFIMDEVDGMSAGDRGGIAAIIEVIKASLIPIICICNDRQSPKVKSLANHCYDIRFHKPHKVQVMRRLTGILELENVSIDSNAVEFVLDSTQSDIRQSLTVLEMWARSNLSISYMQAKENASVAQKDTVSMLGHFDAATQLMNSRNMREMSYKDKLDLFFVDIDLIPLLVHENFLSASTSLENALEAADSIAFSDVLNKKIRGNQEWSLLPSYALASSIMPSQFAGGTISFPKFPEWLGKNSSLNKNLRLAKELKIALHCVADQESLISEFVPMLTQLILDPMEKRLTEGAKESAKILFELGLNPDMLKEHLLTLLKSDQQFKDIPATVRTVLTRYFNNNFKTSFEKTKKKKEGSIKDKFDPDIEDPDLEEVEEAESEEEVEVKAKTIAKAKAKVTAKVKAKVKAKIKK